MERLDALLPFQPSEYPDQLTRVQQLGQPLAGALAAGCFYAPEDRRLWADVFRLIAAQPQPLVGYAWHQEQALRRLPATMALYSSVLGAWAAGNADLIKDLLTQQLRHSYLDPDNQLRELPSCPAYVALAPPEVVDSYALGLGAGAYHCTNTIVEAIKPVLADQFPVVTDFAAAFEELEYLMALLQHHWHEAGGNATHGRWARGTFHSGLVAVPGAIIGPQPESVATRFGTRPGQLDLSSFTSLFEDEDSMANALASVGEHIRNVSWS